MAALIFLPVLISFIGFDWERAAITRFLLVLGWCDTPSECSEFGAFCQINFLIRGLVAGILHRGREN
jgi:hypothetical protein